MAPGQILEVRLQSGRGPFFNFTGKKKTIKLKKRRGPDCNLTVQIIGCILHTVKCYQSDIITKQKKDIFVKYILWCGPYLKAT